MSINWGAVNDVLMSGMRGYGMREDLDEYKAEKGVRKLERAAKKRALEKSAAQDKEDEQIRASSMAGNIGAMLPEEY